MSRLSKLLAERARLGRAIAAIDSELADAYAEKPPRKRPAPRRALTEAPSAETERLLDEGLRKAGIG